MTLRAVGIRFMAYDALPEKYQGWFLSSDDALNRIWYAGAYTSQLNMIPPNTPDGGAQPVIFDGAKRDRLIWVGDIAQDIPTIADSLGSNGAELCDGLAGDLRRHATRIDLRCAAGASRRDRRPGLPDRRDLPVFDLLLDVLRLRRGVVLRGQRRPGLRPQGVVGHRGRARLQRRKRRPVDRPAHHQPARPGGLDWDLYDGPKTGAVTEFNALYYRDLLAGAQMARALGDDAQADTYASQAIALRQAIDTNLYDTATGVYDISTEKRGSIAEDANVAAVLYGVADSDRDAEILAKLKQLSVPPGSEPFSADTGYSTLVSPFIGGFDLQARFAAGDTADAYALMRREWTQMVSPGPQYTGAFSDFTPQGRCPTDRSAWRTAGQPAPRPRCRNMRSAHPVTPGYATWLVAPQPGDLRWAQGQVPTPRGPIDVRWTGDHGRFVLWLRAPAARQAPSLCPPLAT